MSTVANEVGTRLAFTHGRAQSPHHIPADQTRAEHAKRSTTLRNFAGGLAAFLLIASPLHAGELSAMTGESIDLGRFHGVIYYTSTDGGYQVVTTIADGEAAPVRFSATLADNESATISVPGKLGEPGQSLEISRSGDKVTLTKGPLSN